MVFPSSPQTQDAFRLKETVQAQTGTAPEGAAEPAVSRQESPSQATVAGSVPTPTPALWWQR